MLRSAAPSSGFVVDLTSDNTAVATVPASVTVPAGTTSATFGITTSPDTTGSSVIIGTVGGVRATPKYGIIRSFTAFHFGHGTCDSFFPVGTVVRLDARPASGSSLQGWSTNLPGCSNPSRVTIARATNITCRPLLSPK